MIPVKGKSVIVTGASRGVGRAAAFVLAQRGARVACVGRDENALHETVGRITGAGGQAFNIFCDVRDEWSVKRSVEFVLAQFESVDIMINNAAVGIYGRLEDYSLANWRATIDTNLTGPFLFCRAVVPIMRGQRAGRIINVMSGAGRNGIADMGAYCASKFGLAGLTESLALEVRDDGIQVSAVFPGSIDTHFSGRTPGDEDTERSTRERLSPFEVAEAIADLCETNPNAWISELVIRPLRVKERD